MRSLRPETTMNKKTDNGGMKLDLSNLFEPGDLLMLIDALQIGRTTAMMSGGKTGKQAADRFKLLVDALRDIAPIKLPTRRDGYDWLDICQAVKECSHLICYAADERDWTKTKHHIDVHVDGRTWRLVEDVEAGEASENAARVHEYLRSLAPIEAESMAMLKGLVRVEGDIDFPRDDVRDETGRKKFAGLQSAMAEQIGAAAAALHVVAGEPSYIVKDVYEVRFAVPKSQAAAVMARVAEMNAQAIEDYRAKYSGEREISVGPSP